MGNSLLNSIAFPGIGTVINIAAILLGSFLGLILKKILTERITEVLMQGVGLSVLIIGIFGILSSSASLTDGRLSFNNTLIMILSLISGALIGSLIRIQERLESLSEKISRRFSIKDSKGFVEGFLSSSLLFCVGAMAVLGSLEDGLNSNPSILISKSALDFISAMILTGTFGAGVLLSAASVGVYQGLITLLAFFISPLLTDDVVFEMSLIGSVLIVGLSFDILKLTDKLKVSNLIPSIFVPLIYYAFRMMLNNL